MEWLLFVMLILCKEIMTSYVLEIYYFYLYESLNPTTTLDSIRIRKRDDVLSHLYYNFVFK